MAFPPGDRVLGACRAAISEQVPLPPENTSALQRPLMDRKIEAKKVKGGHGSTARGPVRLFDNLQRVFESN
jgi:hypothetical protein